MAEQLTLTPEKRAIIEAGNVAGARASKMTGLRYTPVDTSNPTTPTAPIPSPYAPAPTDSSFSRDVNAYRDAYDPAAQKALQEQINQEAARQRQARIDAINATYNSYATDIKKKGQIALDETRAVNFRSGLVGSDFGIANKAEDRKITSETLAQNETLRNQQIATALSEIDTLASQKFKDQITLNQSNAEARYKYAQDMQTKSLASLANIAKGTPGLTLAQLKAKDPQAYKNLQDTTGMSDFELDTYLTNASKDSQKVLKTDLIGDKVYTVIQNADGSVAVKTYATDIKSGEELKEIDGVAYGVTKGENGQLVLRKLTEKQYKPTGGGGGSDGSGGGQYANDLDAIIGATVSTIPSKFGQATFKDQMSRARDDADKINLVAAQVLKGQPAEFKNDFRNQAVGISMVDKAIKELENGTKTGFLNNSIQYAYNVVGKDYDPKLAKIQGYITSAIQPYRNSVTGAAWGEQEDGEYLSLFGSTKFSPTELKQRLLQVKELLKSKSAEGLNSYVNPLGYYDNQFASGSYSPGGGGNIIIGEDGQEYEIVD